jgi:hypothetical protein
MDLSTVHFSQQCLGITDKGKRCLSTESVQNGGFCDIHNYLGRELGVSRKRYVVWCRGVESSFMNMFESSTITSSDINAFLVKCFTALMMTDGTINIPEFFFPIFFSTLLGYWVWNESNKKFEIVDRSSAIQLCMTKFSQWLFHIISITSLPIDRTMCREKVRQLQIKTIEDGVEASILNITCCPSEFVDPNTFIKV